MTLSKNEHCKGEECTCWRYAQQNPWVPSVKEYWCRQCQGYHEHGKHKPRLAEASP